MINNSKNREKKDYLQFIEAYQINSSIPAKNSKTSRRNGLRRDSTRKKTNVNQNSENEIQCVFIMKEVNFFFFVKCHFLLKKIIIFFIILIHIIFFLLFFKFY